VNESVDFSISDPIAPIDRSSQWESINQKPIESNGKFSHSSRFLRITLSVIGFLPYILRRQLYRMIVSVYSKLRPGNKWDFNW
jgi:hypothetical protein